MKITIEKWKPVKDYEDYYLVSNLGNIKSIEKRVKNGQGYRYIPSKILKPHKNKSGYMQVRLYKNKENKNCYIHRLVAEAFISNPNEYREINHIDENPSNNCISNLEWCDRKYNCNYGSHNEKMANSKSIKVIQYDKDFNKLKVWNSLNDIKRNTNFSIGNICICCKKKRNSANGFIWRYANED